MNCTQVEKLLPLFAGGDLTAGHAEAVVAHLQSCPGCRQLVAEYEASQEWLSSSAPPNFSEAFFEDLRLSVRREIEREASRPSFLQRLLPQWGWRPVLAAAATLLLIITGLALYLGAEKRRENLELVQQRPSQTTDQQPLHSPPPTPNEEGGPEQRPSPGKSPRKLYGIKHGRLPVLAQPERESPPEQVVTIQPSLTTALGTEPANPAVEPEMMRIEIQTAAPNIRIIWLAPKEAKSDSPRSEHVPSAETGRQVATDED